MSQSKDAAEFHSLLTELLHTLWIPICPTSSSRRISSNQYQHSNNEESCNARESLLIAILYFPDHEVRISVSKHSKLLLSPQNRTHC